MSSGPETGPVLEPPGTSSYRKQGGFRRAISNSSNASVLLPHDDSAATTPSSLGIWNYLERLQHATQAPGMSANLSEQVSTNSMIKQASRKNEKLTTTFWEDEGTVCFQVEVDGVCVCRREDNHFINGTKLLNVAGMARGRRDGILKSEKKRHVVKIGPSHLKGVWIPFERALEFANEEGITEKLFPLFVQNPKSLIPQPHMGLDDESSRPEMRGAPTQPSTPPLLNKSAIAGSHNSTTNTSITVAESSLAYRGASIKRSFNRLLSLSPLKENGSYTEFRDASERFQLWAASLGLHQTGHASLDYRFQDAPRIQQLTSELFEQIDEHLVKVTDFFLRPQKTTSPETKDTSDVESVYSDDTSLDELDSIPFDSIILQSILEFIDRLYEVASRIQDPRIRIGGTKAKGFQQINSATGVDLIEAFKSFDRAHIEEYTRGQRHSYSKRSGQLTAAQLEQGLPELGRNDVALVDRLLAANTLRRKQFGHWIRRYAKSRRTVNLDPATDVSAREPDQQDSSAIENHASEAPVLVRPQVAVEPTILSGTTVTRAQDHPAFDLEDRQSVATSAAFTNRTQGFDLDLPIPELPSHVRERAHFECPYCFSLCSQKQARHRYWKKHVLHDLRPYICTENCCNEGDQLFDSYREWYVHILGHTRATQASHEEYRTTCVICKEPEVPLQHVAAHLERIALFSLPKSTGYEAAGDDENASGAQPRTADDDRSELNQIGSFSVFSDLDADFELDREHLSWDELFSRYDLYPAFEEAPHGEEGEELLEEADATRLEPKACWRKDQETFDSAIDLQRYGWGQHPVTITHTSSKRSISSVRGKPDLTIMTDTDIGVPSSVYAELSETNSVGGWGDPSNSNVDRERAPLLSKVSQTALVEPRSPTSNTSHLQTTADLSEYSWPNPDLDQVPVLPPKLRPTNDSPSLPRLDRTMGDIYADSLYNPNSYRTSPSPTESESPNTNNLSPWVELTRERVAAANQGRTQPHTEPAACEDGPPLKFKTHSKEAPHEDTFPKNFEPPYDLDSAHRLREWHQVQRGRAAVVQHQPSQILWRAGENSTISPKETLFGYEEGPEEKKRRHFETSDSRWKYEFHRKYGVCEDCRVRKRRCLPKHLPLETLRAVPQDVWDACPVAAWKPRLDRLNVGVH